MSWETVRFPSLDELSIPVFVTSSRDESAAVKELLSGVDADRVTQFIPEGAGKHGSKALWTSSEGHEEYWTALKQFLEGFR